MVTLPDAEEFRSIVRAELRAALAEFRASLNPAPLVTVEEAARLGGVSVATMRRRIRAGEQPVKRSGRTVRIDPATLRPIPEAEVLELAHRTRFPPPRWLKRPRRPSR